MVPSVSDVLGFPGGAELVAPCYADRASAPPTISLISWVISACRAWFACRLSERMSSSALSVADFIAATFAKTFPVTPLTALGTVAKGSGRLCDAADQQPIKAQGFSHFG